MRESLYVRTPVFATQEGRLIEALSQLDFDSVLEVGCGFGRIGELIVKEWPKVTYTGIDPSPEQLEGAKKRVPAGQLSEATIADFDADSRKWDLVLAVEVLMHIPPDSVAQAVGKLKRLSARYVVTLDWNTDLGPVPIDPINWLHDYAKLLGPASVCEQIGLQGIYVWQKPVR